MTPDENMPSRSAIGTDRLIEVLAKDAGAPRPFGSILLVAAALGVASAAASYLAMLQPRPDIDVVVRTLRVLFKFIVTVPLAVGMIGLLDRIARPAAPHGFWPWLLGGVGAVLAVGVGTELAMSPPAEWAARLVGHNARYCLMFIPLIAIGPLACFIAALRQGMPARPGLAGAAAGIASSAIAAALYATHCPDDSPLFVATWYTLATCIVAACGFIAGRRFL
ncbi:NrsF family protein [Mangrovicella endophytica]|uniref:NrsF family protein n=1 Tax=Mangrovicella endophytica TaxID=2066697 RepID=UPI000C9DE504|nr:NrsF family protein [Mangrovicella endophytica]